MSEFVWWEASLRDELSQGDVLEGVPFSLLRSPLTYVKTHTFRGSEAGYQQTPGPVLNKTEQKNFAIAAVTSTPALVVSHDCAIDKKEKATRVLLAPIGQVKTLEPSMQDTVMHQGHLAMMPLPGIVGLGDCFADLRLITPLQRDFASAATRLASMTENARTRLHAQLVAFFVRRKMATD